MEKPINFNQSFTIRSQKNKLPALASTIPISEIQNKDLQVKRQNYQNRMHELEGSIRMLEKKYKQNLKDGFENKIKSFRLQAVIERKILKATIEQTKKQIDQEQLKQKSNRAQSQRQSQNRRLESINQRILERRRKVRTKAEKQQKQINQKLRQNSQRSLINNRQVHDRILYEMRNGDRKKVYLQTIRKTQNSREIQREKKQCMSRIIQNKQYLQRLQDELKLISEQQKSRLSYKDANPFVTI